MNRIFTIIFLAGYLLPVTSNATTYYISSTGNDANLGISVTQPWQTISKINGINFKGDTILFKSGNTFSGSLNFTASDIGTLSKPIVVGCYGVGKAFISSGNGTGIYCYNSAGFKIENLIFYGSGVTNNGSSGIMFYMDKDKTILPYINLDRVEVYGYHESGISLGSSKNLGGFSDVSITNSDIHDNGIAGISIYGVEAYTHKSIYVGYSKVYNNSGIATQTSGNSGSGIVLGNADGAVIEYCTAYNNGWLHSNQDGGPIGIWAYKCNNVLMQYNESHHNKTGASKDGGGFDLDGGCTNSTMQYNYSHDNYGAGFLLAEYAGAPLMKNITIRYNISENDGRKNSYAGIFLWSSSATTLGIQSVEIYNNTIFVSPGSSGNPSAFLAQNGVFSAINVRNNIFQTIGSAQMLKLVSTAGISLQGNDYWATGGLFKILWGTTNYSSLASWRTSSGQEKLNGASSGFQSDPQFSDTTTGVTFNDATKLATLKSYHLKASSTLIIQGLNLSALFGTSVGTKDFWGNSLAGKTMFNIGSGQSNTIKTLSPAADAYVRKGSYALKNYSSDTSLIVKSSSSSTNYTRNSYLKFALSGVRDVVSAKLRIYGRNTESTSAINISLFSVINDTWTESGINWNNAPASAAFLTSTGTNSQLRYYEFDVTEFVKAQFGGDKIVSFLIKDASDQNKNVTFNSKENAINSPQLIVATTTLTSTLAVTNSFEKVLTNAQTEENNISNLRVYPNPLQKSFVVDFRNKFKDNYYFQIEDESGRVYNIEKRSLPPGHLKITLDITNLFLKAGGYILKVYSDRSKPESIKLIVF